VNEKVGGSCGVHPVSNADGVLRGSRASPNPPYGGESEEHGDEENEMQLGRSLQGSGGLEGVQGRQHARLKHRTSWRQVETQHA